ncbi:serine/threonine protein kinase, putative [Plasmodium sp. gorilla clade G2]|uniref:serine/threonine protein kinase, putative n=1 Tax=Plasmodium sp. gorilla clade G2 TaxID=880535 RepID=UPI000D21364E|nr:serine/threonine protein kinase, putative [Plasmodium sp. gorilla clade G2]SOV17115.1 serine/threonine protein kinase, putative [Plasmodium sp. gorilla clade G2]
MLKFRSICTTLIGGKVYNINGKTIREEKLISEGAYSFVYMAKDLNTNKSYTIKKTICQDKEKINMAKKEIDILKSLPPHKNIVQYYGSTIISENNYKIVIMLMEYCERGNLLNIFEKNKDKIKEIHIVNILKDIITGLYFLHNQEIPIIHRDIKLENILCDKNGVYKICDFCSHSISNSFFPNDLNKTELNKLKEEIERDTTLIYRPPELIDLYSNLEISCKIDIWMLGCILYLLLFKIHPFQNNNFLSIINASFTIPYSTKYSKRIISILLMTLNKNPKNRIDTPTLLFILENYADLKKWFAYIPADIKKRVNEIFEKMNELNINNKHSDLIEVSHEKLIDVKISSQKYESKVPKCNNNFLKFFTTSNLSGDIFKKKMVTDQNRKEDKQVKHNEGDETEKVANNNNKKDILKGDETEKVAINNNKKDILKGEEASKVANNNNKKDILKGDETEKVANNNNNNNNNDILNDEITNNVAIMDDTVKLPNDNIINNAGNTMDNNKNNKSDEILDNIVNSIDIKNSVPDQSENKSTSHSYNLITIESKETLIIDHMDYNPVGDKMNMDFSFQDTLCINEKKSMNSFSNDLNDIKVERDIQKGDYSENIQVVKNNNDVHQKDLKEVDEGTNLLSLDVFNCEEETNDLKNKKEGDYIKQNCSDFINQNCSDFIYCDTHLNNDINLFDVIQNNDLKKKEEFLNINTNNEYDKNTTTCSNEYYNIGLFYDPWNNNTKDNNIIGGDNYCVNKNNFIYNNDLFFDNYELSTTNNIEKKNHDLKNNCMDINNNIFSNKNYYEHVDKKEKNISYEYNMNHHSIYSSYKNEKRCNLNDIKQNNNNNNNKNNSKYIVSDKNDKFSELLEEFQKCSIK